MQVTFHDLLRSSFVGSMAQLIAELHQEIVSSSVAMTSKEFSFSLSLSRRCAGRIDLGIVVDSKRPDFNIYLQYRNYVELCRYQCSESYGSFTG